MNRNTCSRAAMLLATAIVSAPVYAQTGSGDAFAKSDDSAVSEGEIIVTAQKREERLSSVPMSITAASGEQLSNLGIADTTQLAKLVPSFTYQQSNYGTPILAIRGVGFIDNSVTASSTVATYVNQAPLPFPVMTRGATLDVERIEVLKGPQGTLFGQNSTGGAINYIAARPTSEFKAGIDLSYGRFNEVVAGGFVSGPLTDTLRARLALRTEHMDGWQNSMTRPGDRLGAKRFYNGRLLVDWNPSETLKFELNLSAWQDKSDMPAMQLIEVSPQGFVNARTAPIIAALAADSPLVRGLRDADWDPGSNYARNDKYWSATLRGDLELSDAITLTSLTSYSHMTTDRPIDVDGSAITNFTYKVQKATLENFFQELRISGDMASVKWMVGGNYQWQSAREFQFLTHIGSQHTLDLGFLSAEFFGPAAKIYLWRNSSYINNQRPITKSVFANLEYTFGQFTVRGAGRYTDEKRAFNGCLADAGDTPGAQFDTIRDAFGLLSTALSGTPTTIAPNACLTFNNTTLKPELVQTSLNEDNVSWRAGVDWKPNASTLIYANVSKGYKSGGFTVVPAIFATQIAPVTQEALLAYEIGFKASAARGAVTINGAAFYYDYTNKQILGYVQTAFGRLPALVNIPKSRVKGVELEVTARPVEGLRFSGGVSYIDSEVTRDPPTPFDPLGSPTSFVGSAFPNTPKWQGVADMQYTFPIGRGMKAFAGSSLTWRGGSDANFGNLRQFRIPGYALLDLRAGVESADGRWKLQAYGRNVTNHWYWVNVAVTTDTIVRAPGMGATYGLAFSYRY